MDKDRILHSYGVANKMVEIGKLLKLDNNLLDDLFIIGINHDMGCEFDKNNHAEVGGNKLNELGFKYYKEVYYHGRIQDEYNSLYLDILNMADMMIDKYGNDVDYDKRLKDIKSRYGNDNAIYKRCLELVDYLKNKYKEIS